MNRTWELTGMEFVLLRKRLLGRSLPWPFDHVSDAKTVDEFRLEERRTWDRLCAHWDPDLADAVVNAADPDARVQIRARDTREMKNPAKRLRLIGNRFGARALVIRQVPGRTVWHSQAFIVTECEAGELARVMVDNLPKADAGTRGRIELMSYHTRETVDHWYGRSTLDADADAVDVRCRSFQKATKSTVGIIEVRQGRSIYGPRGLALRRLFWEDHPGDGRYVIDLEPPMAAVAADSAALEAKIDAEIAEVMRALQGELRERVVRGSIFDG
jgi:hypothetical protein